MKKDWIYAACLMGLAAACSGTPQPETKELCTVDVAGAMEKQVELKLSELGSDVRYVALETGDSCLIGKNPNILLLDKHIAVYSYKECYLFDKADGHFVCEVGHRGDDPEGYSSGEPTYNDADGLLYFKRKPDGLQKYDLQGRYQGKVTIPTPPVAPTDFAFTDSLAIGYYNSVLQENNGRALLFFDAGGVLRDTLPSLLPTLPKKTTEDIASISVKKFGSGLGGFVFSKFSDGSCSTSINGIPFLWKHEGEVRFKECFSDTVYSVEREGLVPAIAFATGKWHWGAEARTDSRDSESRLLLTTVFETSDNIFFQCVRGLYNDVPEMLNGIFDRRTGTTRICTEEKGITDDLTGFYAFHPKTCSRHGEYAMLVEAGTALEWLEEHPEEAKDERLAALRTLNEDSNPVVMITVP